MANNTEGVGLREKLCNSMGFYLEEIDDGAINVPVGNQTLNNLEALIQQAELRKTFALIRKQQRQQLAEIKKKAKSGTPLTELAKQYKISVQKVTAIVRKK